MGHRNWVFEVLAVSSSILVFSRHVHWSSFSDFELYFDSFFCFRFRFGTRPYLTESERQDRLKTCVHYRAVVKVFMNSLDSRTVTET